MMKDHVFVNFSFAYFCSRVAASFITVLCDAHFAIIYVFIFVIYVCALEHQKIDVAHRNICVCLHPQTYGTSLQ